MSAALLEYPLVAPVPVSCGNGKGIYKKIESLVGWGFATSLVEFASHLPAFDGELEKKIDDISVNDVLIPISTGVSLAHAWHVLKKQASSKGVKLVNVLKHLDREIDLSRIPSSALLHMRLEEIDELDSLPENGDVSDLLPFLTYLLFYSQFVHEILVRMREEKNLVSPSLVARGVRFTSGAYLSVTLNSNDVLLLAPAMAQIGGLELVSNPLR